MKRFAIGLLISLGFVSCQSDEPTLREGEHQQLEALLKEVSPNGATDYFELPDSDDYNAIPQDRNNPITREKVELGQLLFHEPAIGMVAQKGETMQTYSCASCHHAGAGFQSGLRQGIGDGGVGFGVQGERRLSHPDFEESELDVQPIKTPSALNVAYQPNLLWNGQFGSNRLNRPYVRQFESGTPLEANLMGFEGTETQAIAGMGVHRLMVNEDIVEKNGYKEMFDAAFADVDPSERYTILNAALAIAAYERTLLPNQSPWQQWLQGDDNALSPEELRGAILFFDKARCYQCHSGPALNSMEFHALGMDDLVGPDIFNSPIDHAAHLGRGGFTKEERDMYRFKVPQLYNLAEARFYGHGASFLSLLDVVRYKNKAQAENARVPQDKLSQYFTPLNLSESEILDLASFLQKSLNDPNLDRYVPTSLPSGKCFPNNDYLSRLDLNCNG